MATLGSIKFNHFITIPVIFRKD